jgi:hypothetical protein
MPRQYHVIRSSLIMAAMEEGTTGASVDERTWVAKGGKNSKNSGGGARVGARALPNGLGGWKWAQHVRRAACTHAHGFY